MLKTSKKPPQRLPKITRASKPIRGPNGKFVKTSTFAGDSEVTLPTRRRDVYSLGPSPTATPVTPETAPSDGKNTGISELPISRPCTPPPPTRVLNTNTGNSELSGPLSSVPGSPQCPTVGSTTAPATKKREILTEKVEVPTTKVRLYR